MSLDYNLKKIKNQQSYCYVETDKGRRLNPVTNTLVWYTLVIGMGTITKRNADEFFDRVRRFEELSGPGLRANGEPRPITLEDVRGHIGLETNVFPKWSERRYAAKLKTLARYAAKPKSQEAA